QSKPEGRVKNSLLCCLSRNKIFYFLQRSQMNVFLNREAWKPHFWVALIPRLSRVRPLPSSSIWGGRRRNLTLDHQSLLLPIAFSQQSRSPSPMAKLCGRPLASITQRRNLTLLFQKLAMTGRIWLAEPLCKWDCWILQPAFFASVGRG